MKNPAVDCGGVFVCDSADSTLPLSVVSKAADIRKIYQAAMLYTPGQ